MKKNYPLFIQTWVADVGSAILHGQGLDNFIQNWACDCLAEWNSVHVQENEIIWKDAQKNNYSLIGILYHGGKEEFGRTFTEIRAVLIDEQAKSIEKNELQKILLEYNTQNSNYSIELPIKEMHVLSENISTNSSTKHRQRSVLTTMIILLLVVVGIIAVIYKEKFIKPQQQSTLKKNASAATQQKNQVGKNISNANVSKGLVQQTQNTEKDKISKTIKEQGKEFEVIIEGEGQIFITSLDRKQQKLELKEGNNSVVPGIYKIEFSSKKGRKVSVLQINGREVENKDNIDFSNIQIFKVGFINQKLENYEKKVDDFLENKNSTKITYGEHLLSDGERNNFSYKKNELKEKVESLKEIQHKAQVDEILKLKIPHESEKLSEYIEDLQKLRQKNFPYRVPDLINQFDKANERKDNIRYWYDDTKNFTTFNREKLNRYIQKGIYFKQQKSKRFTKMTHHKEFKQRYESFKLGSISFLKAKKEKDELQDYFPERKQTIYQNYQKILLYKRTLSYDNFIKLKEYWSDLNGKIKVELSFEFNLLDKANKSWENLGVMTKVIYANNSDRTPEVKVDKEKETILIKIKLSISEVISTKMSFSLHANNEKKNKSGADDGTSYEIEQENGLWILKSTLSSTIGNLHLREITVMDNK